MDTSYFDAKETKKRLFSSLTKSFGYCDNRLLKRVLRIFLRMLLSQVLGRVLGRCLAAGSACNRTCSEKGVLRRVLPEAA